MKKIVIAVCAAVLAVMVAVGVVSYKKNRDSGAILAAANEELTSLSAEKIQIESERGAKIEEYEKTIGGYANVVLFFDNITENVYDVVYPMMNKYAMRGVMVMKDGELPGDEDTISKNHYDKMIKAGWETAMGGNGGVDMLSSDAEAQFARYLDSYIKKIEQAGYSVPTTYCFEDYEYDEKFLEPLRERGFTAVRTGMTDNEYAEMIDGICVIHSERICSEKTAVQPKFVEAGELSENFGVYTRFVDESDNIDDTFIDCSEKKYGLMLSFAVNDCENLSVITASELSELMERALDKTEYIRQYKKEIAALESRLAEINERVEEISAEIDAKFGN